jgi:hypothetical protein
LSGVQKSLSSLMTTQNSAFSLDHYSVNFHPITFVSFASNRSHLDDSVDTINVLIDELLVKF